MQGDFVTRNIVKGVASKWCGFAIGALRHFCEAYVHKWNYTDKKVFENPARTIYNMMQE